VLPIVRQHEGVVLALNNAHALELSWLDAERLARLLGHA
jgi:predicted GNAT superfamily acetyltransferase